MNYVHLLIPLNSNFIPSPSQVWNFFSELQRIHALPNEPSISTMLLSGDFRVGNNPITGEKISVPRRKGIKIADIRDLPHQLEGLQDYTLRVDGMGPPPMPPFPLEQGDTEFKNSYGYTITASLREVAVSMSSFETKNDKCTEHVPFEAPAKATHGIGVFQNPHTGQLIEVQNAGAAKFWIEFEFGKFLIPKMIDRLDILRSEIVECANSQFQLQFAQGCHLAG